MVAAVPPTAALLAFGALMRQVHQALAERDQSASRRDIPTAAAPEATTTVTIERADDDQPDSANLAEVVPAGVRMLPIVAPPEQKPTFVFDHSRQQYMPSGSTNGYIDWPAPEEPTMVTGPDGERSPDLDDEDPAGDHDRADKVTTSVPAETPRQVVTEVITLTPSELRRRASRLNRELVTSTNRSVTIERLREEFGPTRRDAAELRREVVTMALFTGEIPS